MSAEDALCIIALIVGALIGAYMILHSGQIRHK